MLVKHNIERIKKQGTLEKHLPPNGNKWQIILTYKKAHINRQEKHEYPNKIMAKDRDKQFTKEVKCLISIKEMFYLISD